MQQQPTAPDVLAEAARLDPPRTPYLVRADGSEALAAPTEDDGSDARVKRARWLAHVGYFLQCFGFLGGSGSLIGTLLAHLGKRRARGTWLESHFNWQTETFWMSVVYWI
ncbi:MAG TPA: hypothetical protein VFQ39_12995, partial [Longimicrobium sp.]|nr:hypothetical protein [Longimicrobium sp.]